MSMTMTMSWRNIWRNKRRTLITAAALGVGVLSMVLMLSFVEGFLQRMVRTATEARTGDAQLHAKGYPDTRDETLTLSNPQALLATARQTPRVVAASARTWGMGVLAIGDRSQGAQIVGVDPAHEQEISNWSRRVSQGVFVQGPKDLVIGARLAKKLDVEVGARIVLTIANVKTGEATSELMTIKGVLLTGDTAMDSGAAIVALPTAQRMMGLPDQVHEITLKVDAPRRDEAAIAAVVAPLKAPGRVVRPWHQINRMVSQSMTMMEQWNGVLVFVIYLIIAFGIINTLSMALMERFHEFGVMRALGTTPAKLAALIIAEAGWLGLLGAVPGAIVGLALSAVLARTGVDMSASSQYGMTLIEPIYPVPDVPGAVRAALIFTGLTVLTSTITAIRAATIRPVEALRR